MDDEEIRNAKEVTRKGNDLIRAADEVGGKLNLIFVNSFNFVLICF